ncbi:hypothetical protein BGX26_008700 [Mortierella sp. AD094]|nr:hypothetical protein BGX26_008700 [Mortierella sp. AD094]
MHSTLSISAQDSRGRSSSTGHGDIHGGKLTGVDIHSGQYSHRSGSVTKKNSLSTKFNSAWGSIMKPVEATGRFLKKWTNLTVWIVVAMVVGIIVGRVAPDFAIKIAPLGTVFLRMIQCIVGPLIFSTLVIGIAGHGSDLVRIGRLALKSVVYFEVVTTIALIFGTIAVNVVRPGDGFGPPTNTTADTNVTAITWATELDIIVPTSFFLALSDHTAVLAVVFCAIMFSVAITQVDEKSKSFMLDFNASLSAIMFKIVEMVMNYAPIGIGCAIASTVAEYGLSSLATVGKLVGTLYITLILFVLLVILPIVLVCRFPLREFIWTVGQPFLMAFATSSSESALPKAMENMVEFGVPADIAAFVIPTGYSFNLDGSTLYLAIAVIFCAQVAGINKTVGEQVVIILTLMLTSKGVAAVPRASYIVLYSALSSSNTPLAGLALITAVDAFMDMARTSVNVLGNMTASAVIAKWEGEFRNESWMARRSGQMPETLAMDEPDHDDTALPLHHGDAHFHHSQSLNPMHPVIHGDKTSIHSVESVRSTYSGAYNHHHGSSSQRQYNTYGNSYD